MQEQLGVLKEQLKQEEKEKISLLEKLQKVQELQAQTATQVRTGVCTEWLWQNKLTAFFSYQQKSYCKNSLSKFSLRFEQPPSMDN